MAGPSKPTTETIELHAAGRSQTASQMDSEQYDFDGFLESIKTHPLSNQAVPPNEKFISPCWSLFEYFSKTFLDIITQLGGKTSQDVLKFQQIFYKLRELACSRFHTTLEEKGTIDSYHNKIFQREEKAIKDLSALEQQLQIEREERAKVFSRYEAAENHLHHEEEMVKEEALDAKQQLENEFSSLEENESKSFLNEESILVARHTELTAELKKYQVENRDNELSLRAKKEQSADEVKDLLNEYNQDIKIRMEDLCKIQEDHRCIEERLQVYQSYFQEKERKEFMKWEEKRLKEERRMNEQKRREDAVVFIQFAWRRHKRRKKAKEMQEKKDKDKQGREGKKGAKSSKSKDSNKGSKYKNKGAKSKKKKK